MDTSENEYDPRYLKGIDLFNAGDYFEAHEVWEELWMDCAAGDRRFYQSLIHAAVSIYHAGRANAAGAKRLLGSGSRYASAYANPHLGFDHVRFWREMQGFIEPHPGSAGIGQAPRIALLPREKFDA